MPRRAAKPLGSLPQPEPAAGVGAYLRERELALAADSRRRDNFERFTAAARRSAQVGYLPVKLDIENVSRCNFRCTMCVVGDWKKGRRAADMPLAAFKRLIDEQYGLVEIKLQGIGEPLMQGDDYFEMIRYARARHIWVRTTTNASLLHLRENYRKLIDSGVNEVQISIDGATREVFESIRVGGKFRRVIDNCSLINQYCRSLGLRRTKMWTVVQRANLHQLEALVDLAAAAGFEDLVFSLELSDWGLATMSERNGAASVAADLSRERLAGLARQGQCLGVRVAFWEALGRYSFAEPSALCPWPFERAYVSSDGRVVPCCYIGNPDVLQIGQALASGRGFSDVWTGDAYAAFRAAHLAGNPPAKCAGCYRPGTQTH